MREVWVHLGGDDENGRCLTCLLVANEHQYEQPVRPHRPYPDSDSMDDDIWCWICGHSIGILGFEEQEDSDD